MMKVFSPLGAVALYARVSTDGQSTENQLRELRAAIARLPADTSDAAREAPEHQMQ
jgi:DNA invertase Pin-like site-specific DNA recombinase